MKPASAPIPPPNLVCHDVRPLWTLGGAAAWLRRNVEDLLPMIEDGRLEWAWDIATSGRSRREVRVWFRSLQACKARRAGPAGAPPAPAALSEEMVIAAVIGHSRPLLRGAEVQGILNCDRNQVARFLAAGELLRAGSAPAGARGDGNRSPVILRGSLEGFLRRRRIC